MQPFKVDLNLIDVYKKLIHNYLSGIGAVLLLFLFTMSSCHKDDFKLSQLAHTQWKPDVAVPLAFSSITIQNLLDKFDSTHNVSVGSDNFCTIVYKGNLLSLKASDVIAIPDQTYSQNYTMTPTQIGTLTGSGSVTVQDTTTISFNSGGSADIDSLIYKTGNLMVSLSSDFAQSGQIDVIIPGAKKNGVVFQKQLLFNYNGSVPVTSNANFDLTGYHFDMTDGGSASNQFKLIYKITMNYSGGTVNPGSMLSFSASFTNNHFDKIFGYIGQALLTPRLDTVALSIFRNSFGNGTFNIAEPKLIFTISNSYGIPIQASFATLEGYTPGQGNFPIVGSGVPNPLPIYSPNYSQIGQVLTGSFQVDNSNSNLVTIINQQPKYIIYQLNSMSNPSGTNSHNEFVIDTSRLALDVDVELPLYGTARDFTFQDTSAFQMNNLNNIDSLTLRLDMTNGFPINMGLQLYFVDSVYNVLDSVSHAVSIVTVPSAIVSTSTGMVTSGTEQIDDFPFDKSRISLLEKAKKVIVKAQATTTNNGNMNVKIYSNYTFDVKIGARAHLNVKI